ncbi:MAG: InlB B-repeat-containing protein, partial [Oscillospiraceae bacterium]|nr:InlB B-repeat-containing protein [Oscillospiraceae bacterium]
MRARRTISMFLAVLMAFSVLTVGLATSASALSWSPPPPYVNRTVPSEPKVIFQVPERVMATDINKFKPGDMVPQQIDAIYFRLDPSEPQILVGTPTIKVSNASSDENLLSMLINGNPKISGGEFWWTIEGGQAAIGDVAKFTITYTTQDSGGVRRTWTTSDYALVDVRRGEVFQVSSIYRQAGDGDWWWMDMSSWITGTFGQWEAGWEGSYTYAPNPPGYGAIPTFPNGNLDHGGYGYHIKTEGPNKRSLSIGMQSSEEQLSTVNYHSLVARWGGHYNNSYYAPFDGAPPAASGYTIRIDTNRKEFKGWNYGAGGGEDAWNNDTWETNRYANNTPTGVYYYDQSTPSAAGDLAFRHAYFVDAAGPGTTTTQDGNTRPLTGRGNVITLGTRATGGGSNSATLAVGAETNTTNPNRPDGKFYHADSGMEVLNTRTPLTINSSAYQPNGSYIQYPVEKYHEYGSWYAGGCGANAYHTNLWREKMNLRVVFNDKGFLRHAVNTLKAMNLQENWYLDLDQDSTDDEIGTLNLPGTPYEYYIPWSQFESAYAYANAVLNKKDVTQWQINEATARLLDSVQPELVSNPPNNSFGKSFSELYNETHGKGYVRENAKIAMKSADYGGVDIYLLHDVPNEYMDAGEDNWRYWWPEDFERLDKAIQDIEYDRTSAHINDQGLLLGDPLDIRLQPVLAQLRANLRAALNGLQFRTYEAKFLGHEDSLVQATQVQIYDYIAPPATDPQRLDYVFDGWDELVDGTWVPVRFYDPTEEGYELNHPKMGIYDKVFRARWLPNALTGNFYSEPDVLFRQELAFLTTSPSPPATLIAPSKPEMDGQRYGYTFDRWVDIDNFMADAYFPMYATVRETKNFLAMWLPNKFDVIFYRQPQLYPEWLVENNKAFGTEINEPVGIPLVKGERFEYWTTAPNDPATKVTTWPVTMGNEIKRFFPYFATNDEYWVAFYTDSYDDEFFLADGIFDPDRNIMSSAGVPMRMLKRAFFDDFDKPSNTLVAPKPGFTFYGDWLFLNENTMKLEPFYGFNPDTGKAEMPDHNLYLFPKYVGEGRHMVFHANTGPLEATAPMPEPYSAVNREAGEAFEVGDIPKPLYDNLRFVGWFYQNGDQFISTVMPGDEALVESDGKIHLYAKWAEMKEDNIALKMTPWSQTPNGAALLQGDLVKVDVSVRATFDVYSNYTIIYYDKTYFEPALDDGGKFMDTIQGGSNSTGKSITDYLGVYQNGLWHVGVPDGDVNWEQIGKVPLADYPPDWKDPNTGELLTAYEKYGAIALKIPYDPVAGEAADDLGTEKDWFSFYLRVLPDANPTPMYMTADIFFENAVIRNYPEIRNTGMYYCNGERSDSYVDVEVLASGYLQYIIQETVENPVTLTLRAGSNGVLGLASSEEIIRNIESGTTLAAVKTGLGNRWPEPVPNVGFEFIGWALQNDYDFDGNDASEYLDSNALTATNTILVAMYRPAYKTVTVEYWFEDLDLPTYDKQPVAEFNIQQGVVFSIAPGGDYDEYYKPNDFPGYVYQAPPASVLSVDTLNEGEMKVYMVFLRERYTFTFVMDEATSPAWNAEVHPYQTSANTPFYNGLLTKNGTPQRDGYTFVDWQTSAGTSRPTSFNANYTLKPVWLANPVTVRLIVEDRLDNDEPYVIKEFASTVGSVPWNAPGGTIPAGNPSLAEIKTALDQAGRDITDLNSGREEFIYFTPEAIGPAEAGAVIDIVVGYVQVAGRLVSYHAYLPEGDTIPFPSEENRSIPVGDEVWLPDLSDLWRIFPEDMHASYALEGYFFAWTGEILEPDSEELPVLVPSDPSAVLNVYVMLTTWDSVQFSYNGNGATGGEAPAESLPLEFPETLTIDKAELAGGGTLEKTGYVFAGWSRNAFSRAADDPIVLTTADKNSLVPLYAVWVPLVSFTDHVGALATVPGPEAYPEVYKSSPPNLTQTDLPGPSLSNPGYYQLIGWSVTQQAPAVTPGIVNEIAYNGALELFPVLAIRTYRVDFVLPDEGTQRNDLEDITGLFYGDSVGLPVAGQATAPTIKGYALLGWTSNAVDRETVEFTTEIASVAQNYTLYPVWEQQFYNVTFSAEGADAGSTVPGTDGWIGLPYYEYTQEELPQPGEGNYDPEFYLTLTSTENPEKEYEFIGWATEPGLIGTEALPATIELDDNVTLYPVFKELITELEPEIMEIHPDIIVDDYNDYIYGFKDKLRIEDIIGEDGATDGAYLQVKGNGRFVADSPGEYVGTGYVINFVDYVNDTVTPYTMVL